ncbi:MAG: hypothetical protein KatS3mg103_1007 [Phycisphaerales bacterium]|nr:MAG: hypothetical protein KatS3mg103_1007 [Phycisphaerales bacterium]
MLRSLTIGSVLLAWLVGSASAWAQAGTPDPVEVAQRCVAQMEQAADRTTDAVATATRSAIDRIADLDAAGAPDRAIIAAGKAGSDRVARLGAFGVRGITHLERRCVGLLVRLEADRRLIERVRDAAEGFREDIMAAVRRGTMAIRQAVADAIG